MDELERWKLISGNPLSHFNVHQLVGICSKQYFEVLGVEKNEKNKHLMEGSEVKLPGHFRVVTIDRSQNTITLQLLEENERPG